MSGLWSGWRPDFLPVRPPCLGVDGLARDRSDEHVCFSSYNIVYSVSAVGAGRTSTRTYHAHTPPARVLANVHDEFAAVLRVPPRKQRRPHCTIHGGLVHLIAGVIMETVATLFLKSVPQRLDD